MKIKKILITALFVLLPAPVLAQSLTSLDTNLTGCSAATVTNDKLPACVYNAIATFISTRVYSLLIDAAITLATLFIFYGAMQYFTAYGDENRATNAKKTLAYAFLGLVLAFMAMGIASLVELSVTNKQSLQNQQVQVR